MFAYERASVECELEGNEYSANWPALILFQKMVHKYSCSVIMVLYRYVFCSTY